MGSDFEQEAQATLKLTARGRGAFSPGPRRRSRDETKKEEDDEATLRELLIRYPTTPYSSQS